MTDNTIPKTTSTDTGSQPTPANAPRPAEQVTASSVTPVDVSGKTVVEVKDEPVREAAYQERAEAMDEADATTYTPASILGADRAALVGDAERSAKGFTATAAVEGAEPAPVALPDNSPKALAENHKLVNARGFLRAQGAADHLYSDEQALSEYDRFKKQMDEDVNKPFKLNLPKQKTHFDKNEGIVTRGEYSTAQNDSKPNYRDASKADSPTPAKLLNESEIKQEKK